MGSRSDHRPYNEPNDNKNSKSPYSPAHVSVTEVFLKQRLVKPVKTVVADIVLEVLTLYITVVSLSVSELCVLPAMRVTEKSAASFEVSAAWAVAVADLFIALPVGYPRHFQILHSLRVAIRTPNIFIVSVVVCLRWKLTFSNLQLKLGDSLNRPNLFLEI